MPCSLALAAFSALRAADAASEPSPIVEAAVERKPEPDVYAGRIGTRYFEIRAGRETEEINDYVGYILSADATLNIPLTTIWMPR